MGAVVLVLNRKQPHEIAVADVVSGDITLAVSTKFSACRSSLSIDPDRVFVVDEWHTEAVEGCEECKKSFGHYRGRIVRIDQVKDLERTAKDLSNTKEMLLNVIDHCHMGPCPKCGAVKLTRINEEWICNAVIDDSGTRCDFRKPLDFFTSQTSQIKEL